MITWGAIKEGIALSVASLIFSGRPSKALSLVCSFLEAILKISLIVDYRLISFDFPEDHSYDRVFGTTVLAKNGNLFAFFHNLNFVNAATGFDPVLVFVGLAVCGILIIATGLGLLFFAYVKNWSWVKPSHRPDVPFYFGLIKLLVFQAEFFLTILLLTVSKVLVCSTLAKDQLVNNYNTSLLELDFTASLSNYVTQTSVRYTSYNNQILCWGLSHISLSAITIQLLCWMLWIKYISYKVHSFAPNHLFPLSSTTPYSIFAVLQPVSLVFLKIYTLAQTPTSRSISFFLVVSALLAALNLFAQIALRPYHHNITTRIKRQEQILLLLFSMLILAIRSQAIPAFLNIPQTLVYFGFAYTACLKITNILETLMHGGSELPSPNAVENISEGLMSQVFFLLEAQVTNFLNSESGLVPTQKVPPVSLFLMGLQKLRSQQHVQSTAYHRAVRKIKHHQQAKQVLDAFRVHADAKRAEMNQLLSNIHLSDLFAGQALPEEPEPTETPAENNSAKPGGETEQAEAGLTDAQTSPVNILGSAGFAGIARGVSRLSDLGGPTPFMTPVFQEYASRRVRAAKTQMLKLAGRQSSEGKVFRKDLRNPSAPTLSLGAMLLGMAAKPNDSQDVQADGTRTEMESGKQYQPALQTLNAKHAFKINPRPAFSPASILESESSLSSSGLLSCIRVLESLLQDRIDRRLGKGQIKLRAVENSLNLLAMLQLKLTGNLVQVMHKVALLKQVYEKKQNQQKFSASHKYQDEQEHKISHNFYEEVDHELKSGRLETMKRATSTAFEKTIIGKDAKKGKSHGKVNQVGVRSDGKILLGSEQRISKPSQPFSRANKRFADQGEVEVDEHANSSVPLGLSILSHLVSLHLRDLHPPGPALLPPPLAETQSSSLLPALQFFNRYNAWKQELFTNIQQKSRLLSRLATGLCEYKRLFPGLQRFSERADKVTKEAAALHAMSDGKFTTVKMLEGLHCLHAFQDLKRGTQLVKEALRQRIYMNANYFTEISLLPSSLPDKVVLAVGGEQKNFHSIAYATCNIAHHLGFDAPALRFRDLSVLIPEPLKDKHKVLLQPELASGRGLERRVPLTMVALDSAKRPVMCRITTRLNHILSDGLQFVGGLEFPIAASQEGFMLVSEDLKVSHVNRKSSRYFEAGNQLADYSRELADTLQKMNYVADLRLRMPEMNVDRLLSQPQGFLACQSFYTMASGCRVQIRDKRDSSRQIFCLVNDLYIPRAQEWLRCLHLVFASSDSEQSNESTNYMISSQNTARESSVSSSSKSEMERVENRLLKKRTQRMSVFQMQSEDSESHKSAKPGLTVSAKVTTPLENLMSAESENFHQLCSKLCYRVASEYRCSLMQDTMTQLENRLQIVDSYNITMLDAGLANGRQFRFGTKIHNQQTVNMPRGGFGNRKEGVYFQKLDNLTTEEIPQEHNPIKSRIVAKELYQKLIGFKKVTTPEPDSQTKAIEESFQEETDEFDRKNHQLAELGKLIFKLEKNQKQAVFKQLKRPRLLKIRANTRSDEKPGPKALTPTKRWIDMGSTEGYEKEELKAYELQRMQLSRIIATRTVKSRSLFSMVATILIIGLFSLAQFATNYAAVKIDNAVNLEIRNKSITIDQNSFGFWASTYLVDQVDQARLVYLKYLQDDYYLLYQELLLTAATYRSKIGMINYPMASNMVILGNMRNLSFPMFSDSKLYTNEDAVEFWYPLVSRQQRGLDGRDSTVLGTVQQNLSRTADSSPTETAGVVWQSEKLGMLTMLQHLQPFVDAYCRRNDTEYLGKAPFGRSQDLLAEFLRKNLDNDVLAMLFTQQTDIQGYFRTITTLSVLASRYGVLLQLAILVLVVVVLFVLSRRKIGQMAGFWDNMLRFKVKFYFIQVADIKTAAEEFETACNDIARVVADEKYGFYVDEQGVAICGIQMGNGSGTNRLATDSKAANGSKDRIRVRQRKALAASGLEEQSNFSNGPRLITAHQGYGFGLYRKLCVLLALNLILVAGYFAHSLYRVSTAVVLANYMELYNLVVETWNVHATMHSALTSYLLWNDTTTIMNKRPSEVYMNMSSQFKSRIIPKYESFFKADLGDFQSYYNQFSTSGHICRLIKPFTRAEYKNCGEGLASFIDESIPIFLKSTVSILDETYFAFGLAGRTEAALKQAFTDQKYRVYQAYFTNGRLMSDFYYLILRPLGLQIEAIVFANKADVASGLSDPNDNPDLRLYVYLFLPLFFIYLGLLIYCFILPVYRILIVYWYAIRLIPLNLIDKNPWLMHYFRKVQTGTHDFVQF